MKVHAIGIQRLAGISKKTGKPYDFSRLLILRPIEPTSSPEFSVSGFGYEATGLDVDNDAIQKFGRLSWPCELELTTDTRPGRTGFQTVITGFAQSVKAAA